MPTMRAASMDLLLFTRPSIDETEQAAVAAVLASGWLASGPKVAAFDAALAELFGFYRRLGYGPGDSPVAERIGALTLFPAMSDEDVDRVCEAIEGLLHA